MAILLVATFWFCVKTIRWPMVGDASLMSYVVFLTDHGDVPYRNIPDVNWPVAYLPDWLVAHTVGASALAWRLYDFVLLASTGIAMISLGRRVSWKASLWAALLFALIHGRDGLYQVGQRDLAIAALLAIAVCVLLRYTRGARLHWLPGFAFGIAIGIAGMIKPTALPFVILAVPTLWRHDAEKRARSVFALAVLGGLVIPVACTFLWLLRIGALRAFLQAQNLLTPFHASLERRSAWYLVMHACSPLLPLVALWLALLLAHRLSFLRNAKDDLDAVERSTLLLGLLLGFFAYVVQGKGYPYHRYSLLVFLLMVIARDLDDFIEAKGKLRWAAVVVFAAAAIGIGVPSAVVAGNYGRQEEFQHSVEADLTRIASMQPNVRLDRGVQCLDSISGCTNALYEMRLVQSTGLIYDEFLFHHTGIPAVDATRAAFARGIKALPPEIFVVSAPLFPDGPDNFQKLQAWPDFVSWLAANYTIVVQREAMKTVRQGGPAITPPGYRIYLRDDLIRPSVAAKAAVSTNATGSRD